LSDDAAVKARFDPSETADIMGAPIFVARVWELTRGGERKKTLDATTRLLMSPPATLPPLQLLLP